MKKKTKTLLTALAVPLGAGAVSGFLTQGSMDTFEKLKQPPLTPVLDRKTFDFYRKTRLDKEERIL